MLDYFKNNKFILIIILSTLFGLSGGMAGGLWARNYLNGEFSMLNNEINLSEGALGQQNFVIREAKKVVVEQNDKITETISASKDAIVGIFKKTETAKIKKQPNSDLYFIKNEVGQGLILTSDGWIITNYKIDKPENYIVITNDKKIYEIDKYYTDKLTNYNLIHINSRNLPVKNLLGRTDIKNGNLIVAVNWEGESFVTAILNNFYISNKESNIYASDEIIDKIKIINNLGEKFKGSPVFDLAGNVIGLSLGNDQIEPIYHFTRSAESIVKFNQIKRPTIGINYLDLSLTANSQYGVKGIIIQKDGQNNAISKGSAAETAGLKEGDLIIAFDDIELNDSNNINGILNNYLPEEQLDMVFIRNNEKKEIMIKLGGL